MGDEHYFSENATSEDVRRTYTLEGPAGPITIETASGVFASRGLDRGTEVLFGTERRHPCPAPPPGSHLCDLGAGAGPIALWLAAAHPGCTVHAIDVNDRARRLCRSNAQRNGLTNIVVNAPGDVDPSIRFRLLWSNPPVRIGKAALHDLLSDWLDRLHPDGLADLVVGRNLGADTLAAWLADRGNAVERIASSKGFRVLRLSPRRLRT